MELPKYFAIKSERTNKYLYLTEEYDGTKLPEGYIGFTGEEIKNPFAKFEFVKSENRSGDDDLVHIKCCYNNKFWTVYEANKSLIIANANEPEEDQSKPSCTLLKPSKSSDATSVLQLRLLHVHTQRYLSRATFKDPPFDIFLSPRFQNPGEENAEDLFTITNWETITLELPKTIAFKGYNAKFLRATTEYDGLPFLKFSANDFSDPTVINEVSYTKDGEIRIWSKHFQKFWRLGPSWILADYEQADSSHKYEDTIFKAIKVDNVIALRNMSNQNFCISLTADNKEDCLNAAVPSVPLIARLQVVEPVLSRRIDNVQFKTDRIDFGYCTLKDHDEMIRYYDNIHGSQPSNEEVHFKYKEVKTKIWSSTTSWGLGFTVSLKSEIPLVAEGQVEFSGHYDKQYVWGSNDGIDKEETDVHKVTVQAGEQIKVTATATRYLCNIPFAYTQTDTLSDGTTTSIEKNDGLYTGVRTEVKFKTQKTN